MVKRNIRPLGVFVVLAALVVGAVCFGEGQDALGLPLDNPPSRDTRPDDILDGTAEYTSFEGDVPLVSINADLAANGESPALVVRSNWGAPMGMRVSASFGGDEMWSSADMDSTNVLEEPTTFSNRDSYVYTFGDSLHAFEGDTVTAWVWFYDQAGNEFLFSDQTVFDLPGEIRHLVIKAPTGDPDNDLFDDYVAAGADTLHYGVDVPFAMGEIVGETPDSDGTFNAIIASYSRCDEGDLTMPPGNDDNSMLLWYVDFGAVIPSDAFIIDSRLNICAYSTLYMAKADSLVSITMTNPQDNLWHTGLESDYTGAGGEYGYSYASYNYQIQGQDTEIDGGGDLGDLGYPATSVGAWSPALDDRTDMLDWGSIVQWTSEVSPDCGYSDCSNARVQQDNFYSWILTRGTQHAVSGGTYNGFVLLGYDESSMTSDIHVYHTGTNDDWKKPYMTISYLTGDHGAEPAFPDDAQLIATFSSDDGFVASNDAWAQVAKRYGVRYTISVNEDNLGAPNGYYDVEDLIRWREDGMEIASHSRYSMSIEGTLYGVAGYDSTGLGRMMAGGVVAADTAGCDTTGYSTASTGVDSLSYDIDSCWLFEKMGPQYEDDIYVGRSFNLPANLFTPQGTVALARHGYISVRGTTAGPINATEPDGQYGWFTLGSLERTWGDSLRVSFPMHRLDAPIYAPGAAVSFNIQDLVGHRDSTFTEEKLRNRIRYHVIRHMGRNQLVMNFFTHDAKGELGGLYTSGGMTVDEFEILCDELENLNVPLMCLGDVARWKYSVSVPVQIPDSYQHDASVAGIDRDDGWWRRMKWLQARNIQGVVRMTPQQN